MSSYNHRRTLCVRLFPLRCFHLSSPHLARCQCSIVIFLAVVTDYVHLLKFVPPRINISRSRLPFFTPSTFTASILLLPCYRFRGLPCSRRVANWPHVTLLAILFSPILLRCVEHRNRRIFINRTIVGLHYIVLKVNVRRILSSTERRVTVDRTHYFNRTWTIG